MEIIDFLTSGIGYTVNQLKEERRKQGYLITREEDNFIVSSQKFPILKYEINIFNYFDENSIVEHCYIDYSDEHMSLKDEFLSAIRYYDNSVYKEFINPQYGNQQIGITGYFLSNGDYLNDYECEISKIPDGYIPIEIFMQRVYDTYKL